MFRVGALVFCVGLLLAAPTGGARAETAICADLQRQLSAALNGGGGGSAEQLARRLIGQQAEAGANGCAGFSLGKPETAQCPAIMASLRQLRADLARAQAPSGSSPAVLRAQLARNGCRESPRTVVAGGGGAVRTICVRTCDGYFFPIGNLNRRDKYKTHAEVCQSMYATAGEAELFVQRRQDDISTAVSVDGKLAYADQPYAFIFKHLFSRSCQAQLHGGLTALGARYHEAMRSMPPKTATKGKGKAASEVTAVDWPPPRLRPPAIGEDPETVAVRAGDLVEVFLKPAKHEVASAGRRTIRHVGESWYATLHDPARPPDPPPTYRPPLGFDLIGAARAERASEMEAAAMIVDVLTQ